MANLKRVYLARVLLAVDAASEEEAADAIGGMLEQARMPGPNGEPAGIIDWQYHPDQGEGEAPNLYPVTLDLDGIEADTGLLSNVVEV